MPKGKGPNAAIYTPTYPTTIGAKNHAITFQKLPAFSIGLPPKLICKKFSPGPAAYPKIDSSEKAKGNKPPTQSVPKSLYPEDKAHKYTMGGMQNPLKTPYTPGPAQYPAVSKNRKTIISLYPLDKANKFSIPERKNENYKTVSPGPASYPRDVVTTNINSIHPNDKANRFSLRSKYDERNVYKSPGPAVYPNLKDDPRDPNKIATIYPRDKMLPMTIKQRHEIKNREQIPAPNAYPVIDTKWDPKKPLVDAVKTLIPSKRAPQFQFGERHTTKQHILVLPDDEY